MRSGIGLTQFLNIVTSIDFIGTNHTISKAFRKSSGFAIFSVFKCIPDKKK